MGSPSGPPADVVGVEIECVPVLSRALAQAGVPAVSRLLLTGTGDSVRRARVHVRAVAGDRPLGPAVELTADVASGRTTVLTDVPLRLDPAALPGEETAGAVEVRVECDGRFLGSASTSVRVLGARQWLAAPAPLALEVLAAHVLPDDPAVAALVGAAADLLALRTGDAGLPDDPAATDDDRAAERIDRTAGAVVEAMRRRGVRLTDSPADWTSTPQPVRTPTEVLDERLGSALDTAVVLAAALEHAGLRPLLWVAAGGAADPDHAFAGYWRTLRGGTSAVGGEVEDLVELVDRGEIQLVDAAMLTADAEPATFGDLHRTPHAAWLTGDPTRILGVTDVHRARLDAAPAPTAGRGVPLGDHPAELLGGPLLTALAEGGAPFRDPAPHITVDVDVDALAGEVPLPADASQLRAVAEAAAGRTFVLDAAPGTGASQTITNILARAVADGRRVLLVADRPAALDVVARRLDAVGMGPLTRDLREDTAPARPRARPATAAGTSPADAPDVQAAVRVLADYAHRLHEPNRAGLSLYAAATLLPADDTDPGPSVPPRFPADTSVRTVAAIRRMLATLPPLAAGTRPRRGHPWGLIDRPDVDPVAVHQAVLAVDRAVDAVPVEGPLAEVLAAVRTPADLDALVEVLAALTGGAPVPLVVLDATRTPEWAAGAVRLRTEVAAFAGAAHPGLDLATPAVLDLPLADLAADAVAAATSGRLGRGKRLAAVLDRLTPGLRAGARVEPAQVPALTADLLGVQAAARALAAAAADLSGLSVPADWNPLTDPHLVERQVTRLRRLGEALVAADASFLPDLRFFLAGEPAPGQAEVAIATTLRSAFGALLPALATTAPALVDWAEPGGLLPHWSATRAERGADTFGLPSLGHWLDLLRPLELLRAAGLTDVRAALLSGAVPAADAVGAFDRALAAASAVERRAATGLAAADAAAAEQAARRLPTALRAARARMAAALAQLDPGADGPPCVLADPASVDAHLPATAGLFDLVVVDGADQLPVADVAGALGRGRAAVVVGNSGHRSPAADGAPPAGPDLLGTCLRAGVPRLRLERHHRSADETLFAFANATYHGNRLVTVPAPDRGPASSLVRVPGTFHRAGLLPGTNPVEARAVVAEVLRRIAAEPDAPPSLAVVTLHPGQRDLVARLLRDAAETQPGAGRNAADGVLVAHVADVRGEERDTVLLSLGGSPDARGTRPPDLGPLGRAGGERHLEVAITRARRQLVVYASFDPEQLRAEATGLAGLRHLRAWLDLVAAGADVAARHGRAVLPADPHRDDVAAALRARGLVVRTDVGLSAVRIDLTVAPATAPEVPLLAVLLDGPAWGARATVTDRDAVPGAALARAGWPAVERVWLPAWSADREAVLDRLTAALDAAALRPALAGPLPPLPARAEAAPVPMPVDVPAADVPVDVPPADVPADVPPIRHSGHFGGTPVAEEAAVVPVRVTSRPAVPAPTRRAPRPAPGPLPGERPFVAWTPEQAGDPRVFRRLHDPQVATLVRRVLAAGIAAEGPIHRERLVRLTAGAFGVTRVNEARRDSILALLPDPAADFRWPRRADPSTWAGFRRQDSAADRPLEHVAPEEIGNAMVALCRSAAGMTRDELFSRTLAVFGHRRRHPVLVPHLEAALALAVRASRVTREPAGRLIHAA